MLNYLGHAPYVCHRLDMSTSGVVLFAKTKAAAAAINEQFRWALPTGQFLVFCEYMLCAAHKACLCRCAEVHIKSPWLLVALTNETTTLLRIVYCEHGFDHQCCAADNPLRCDEDDPATTETAPCASATWRSAAAMLSYL